jgi:hypothetical protein
LRGVAQNGYNRFITAVQPSFASILRRVGRSIQAAIGLSECEAPACTRRRNKFMETYELALLHLIQGAADRPVPFSRAKLMVVSEYGTRMWYIDAEGIRDAALLNHYAKSEEIGVRVRATTIGGKKLEGDGFFHPNPQHRSAAIRGNGELAGYEE